MKNKFNLTQIIASLLLAQAILNGELLFADDMTIKPDDKKSEFKPEIKTQLEFKYRHQATSEENQEERRIQRISFKFGQSFTVLPELQFNYRLMTGSNATGSNVTLGDSKTAGAARQSIGLDHAYIVYTIKDEEISDIKLQSSAAMTNGQPNSLVQSKDLNKMNEYKFIVGKAPQVFYFAGGNQVVLDKDIALEGITSQVQIKDIGINDLKTQFNIGSYWMREKYDDTYGKDKTDTFLNAAQIIFNYDINSYFTVKANYGLLSYTGIKNDSPSSFVNGATSARGNTLDILNMYANEYEMEQKSFEVKAKISSFDVNVFVESIKNKAASSLNNATVYGTKVSYSNFSLSVIEQKIESDATFALYSDADFADQNTNSQGQILSLGYKFSKFLNVNFSQTTSKKDVSSVSPSKYNKSTLDLNFVY